MDNIIERKKIESQQKTQELRETMRQLVDSEREKGKNRLEELYNNVNKFLDEAIRESNNRIIENKIDAIKEIIKNHNKRIAEINPNWDSDLQNKYKESLEKILVKGIEEIMNQSFSMEEVMKKYYPEK